MGLHHFLYLCPLCGHDPLEKQGFRARCAGCGKSFEQGEGALIRILDPAGEFIDEAPAHLLARQIEGKGLDGDNATTGGNEGVMEAPVVARYVERERSIFRDGAFLGLIESQGRRRPGVLRMTALALEFMEGNGQVDVWQFEELRAIQASSSSIQISPNRGGVVTFRFASASCRRWEEALKQRVRRRWVELGRGEIAEFQPRIRSL